MVVRTAVGRTGVGNAAQSAMDEERGTARTVVIMMVGAATTAAATTAAATTAAVIATAVLIGTIMVEVLMLIGRGTTTTDGVGTAGTTAGGGERTLGSVEKKQLGLLVVGKHQIVSRRGVGSRLDGCVNSTL